MNKARPTPRPSPRPPARTKPARFEAASLRLCQGCGGQAGHSLILPAPRRGEAGALRLSRRRFLSHSALLLCLAAARGPSYLRAGSPGEKLNIGLVGVGGQGAGNLNAVSGENIAALCDVDEQRLSAAAAKFPGAKRHRDFRKMLEQKEIDAVVVTTPDHTHAVAAMAAIRLGKHVYCEKPLTHSVYEARQIARAAREHKVATQMGNGGHSGESIRQVVEWIRAGVIGAVREVHAWSDRPIWPQGIDRPEDRPEVPKHLDWDLWLGPAPLRPFHPAYHPFKWRGWWDFGTGALGDMGCHIIDGAFWALELGHPASVEAESPPANSETAPLWSKVRYQFPAQGSQGPVALTWYDGGQQPGRELTELEPGQELGSNGSLFIGEKGKLLFARRAPELLPRALMEEFEPPPKTLPRSIGHHAEWIAACKGGPAAGSNFDYAGPLTELVLLGNVALRLGRKIEWDGEKLEARNVPQAAALIRREYRSGWTL